MDTPKFDFARLAVPDVSSIMPDFSDSIAKMHREVQEARDWNSAVGMRERIVQSINDFEKTLDADHEIGMRLVSGPNATFHILDVGFYDPDLVVFHGIDPDGQALSLVQSITQINILLAAVKKLREDEPPAEWGFASSVTRS